MMLELENNLTKGRFREESFTDLFTASLAALQLPGVRIAYPPERTTGGDLDLCFLDRRSGESISLRIQAKRLSAASEGDRNVGWRIRRYDHLDHFVRTSAEYQFRLLTETPRSFVPLYAFYNHQSVVDDVRYGRPGRPLEGINFAFATHIAAMLDPYLPAGTSIRAPTRVKRLISLQDYFFGLHELFCPFPGPIPRPRDIVLSLRRAFREVERTASIPGQRLSEIDSEQMALSPDFYSGEGTPFRVADLVERPTLFFISDRRDE